MKHKNEIEYLEEKKIKKTEWWIKAITWLILVALAVAFINLIFTRKALAL